MIAVSVAILLAITTSHFMAVTSSLQETTRSMTYKKVYPRRVLNGLIFKAESVVECALACTNDKQCGCISYGAKKCVRSQRKPDGYCPTGTYDANFEIYMQTSYTSDVWLVDSSCWTKASTDVSNFSDFGLCFSNARAVIGYFGRSKMKHRQAGHLHFPSRT
jgi:hypothetical protein